MRRRIRDSLREGGGRERERDRQSRGSTSCRLRPAGKSIATLRSSKRDDANELLVAIPRFKILHLCVFIESHLELVKWGKLEVRCPNESGNEGAQFKCTGPLRKGAP
jgi:hypothetical protein